MAFVYTRSLDNIFYKDNVKSNSLLTALMFMI